MLVHIFGAGVYIHPSFQWIESKLVMNVMNDRVCKSGNLTFKNLSVYMRCQ